MQKYGTSYIMNRVRICVRRFGESEVALILSLAELTVEWR